MPVEIKAGATIADDYLKGLRAFAARLPEPPRRKALVYGGSERQSRSEAMICRLDDVAALMGTLSQGG